MAFLFNPPKATTRDHLTMKMSQGCAISDSSDTENKSTVHVQQKTNIKVDGNFTLGGDGTPSYTGKCPNGAHGFEFGSNTASIKMTSHITDSNISKQTCVNATNMKAKQSAKSAIKGLFPSGTSSAEVTTHLAARNQTVMNHFIYSSVKEAVDVTQTVGVEIKGDVTLKPHACSKARLFSNSVDIEQTSANVVRSNLIADAQQSASADITQVTSATTAGLSFGFLEFIIALILCFIVFCGMWVWAFVKITESFSPAGIMRHLGILGVLAFIWILYALFVWPGSTFMPNFAKSDGWWPIGSGYDIGALSAICIFALLTQIINVMIIFSFRGKTSQAPTATTSDTEQAQATRGPRGPHGM